MQTDSLVLPRLTIQVDHVGHNSLIGGVVNKLREMDMLKHIEDVGFTEVVFVIKGSHTDVNLYEEINKVRDDFRLQEKQITVFLK
jgi:hypothetical protein